MHPKTSFLLVLFATLALANSGKALKEFVKDVILYAKPLSECPFSSKKAKVERTKDVADPETTTPYGCTCTSICGATVEDGFTVSFEMY